MIHTKNDLKDYLKTDYSRYPDAFSKKRWFYKFEKDYIYLITVFIKYLRYSEFYYNNNKKIRLFLIRKKKNRLERKLNIVIPLNTVGKGLLIEHGNVIINQGARIGENAIFHGFNVVGTKANGTPAPAIGNNFNLGCNSTVIGPIKICDNVRVGANSLIIKNIENSGIYAGNPLRKIH